MLLSIALHILLVSGLRQLHHFPPPFCPGQPLAKAPIQKSTHAHNTHIHTAQSCSFISYIQPRYLASPAYTLHRAAGPPCTLLVSYYHDHDIDEAPRRGTVCMSTKAEISAAQTQIPPRSSRSCRLGALRTVGEVSMLLEGVCLYSEERPRG